MTSENLQIQLKKLGFEPRIGWMSDQTISTHLMINFISFSIN